MAATLLFLSPTSSTTCCQSHCMGVIFSGLDSESTFKTDASYCIACCMVYSLYKMHLRIRLECLCGFESNTEQISMFAGWIVSFARSVLAPVANLIGNPHCIKLIQSLMRRLMMNQRWQRCCQFFNKKSDFFRTLPKSGEGALPCHQVIVPYILTSKSCFVWNLWVIFNTKII